MSEGTKAIDLGEVQRELEDATYALDEARVQEDQARKATTTALNRVNAAHKALDDAIASLRKNAPSESDWNRWRSNRSQGESP